LGEEKKWSFFPNSWKIICCRWPPKNRVALAVVRGRPRRYDVIAQCHNNKPTPEALAIQNFFSLLWSENGEIIVMQSARFFLCWSDEFLAEFFKFFRMANPDNRRLKKYTILGRIQTWKLTFGQMHNLITLVIFWYKKNSDLLAKMSYLSRFFQKLFSNSEIFDRKILLHSRANYFF